MKKSDLKNGMVVELENNERRMVLNDKLIDKDGYILLRDYNETLSRNGYDKIQKIFISNGMYFEDILEDKSLKLIWERKEPITLEKAMKYFYNGGTIIWKSGTVKYMYEGKDNKFLVDRCERPLSASQLLEGEWYIQ